MFVRRGSPLSRVAVTWSRTEKGTHFLSTIYSAVLVIVEGGIVSRSADSARLFHRFSSPMRMYFPFLFFFPSEHVWFLWTESLSPSPPSPRQPLLSPGSLLCGGVCCIRGVSFKIKLAPPHPRGGTEMHNPSGAFVC